MKNYTMLLRPCHLAVISVKGMKCFIWTQHKIRRGNRAGMKRLFKISELTPWSQRVNLKIQYQIADAKISNSVTNSIASFSTLSVELIITHHLTSYILFYYLLFIACL